jgi:hypothetical protein
MSVQDGEPLPGTVNQQDFTLWDQAQRDARKAGEEYEPPADMMAEGSDESDSSAGSDESDESTAKSGKRGK